MRKITFGEPVLKIKGLEARFDVIPVSNSLAILIGDRDTASIVQQLYHWTEQGYGEVIDGVRWFYKSIDEWIREVFPTFTPWKLGKMMKQLSDRGIIRREKLFTKHQIQKGDRFWWQPKNQTYYYSLNTDKLQELADNFHLPQEKAETIETSVFIKTQILSSEEIKDTKDFDCAKNNTKNTSIENISRDQSHPTLPCEGEQKKGSNQEKELYPNNRSLDNQEEVNSVTPEVIEKDTNVGQVEENINQNIGTNSCSAQVETEQLQKNPKASPKLKVTPTKQKRENKAPWKDETEKSLFYRALIQALPIVANSYSPQGLAKTIMAQLKRGEEHTYWDDFQAGLPIGTSTKPEWEVKPGIPHPMFIEYLAEKLIKGNNSQTREQAIAQALNIASSPKQAMFFWKECKISLGNALSEAERHRQLGVKALPTPLWTKERREPTLTEAAIAGTKIQQINGSAQVSIEAASNPQLEGENYSSVSVSPSPPVPQSLEDPWTEDDRPLTMREMLEARGVKGFAKAMPKVTQDEVEAEKRRQTKPKTNIATMSLDEINEFLKDPISRTELTPQLIDSNYELITDEIGQIIGVKLSEVQKRERQAESTGE